MMLYSEVLERAREVLSPKCRVCPICDGRACTGRVPGPGGKGSGATARRNYDYLAEHVKLRQRVVRGPYTPDCSTTWLGRTWSMPVFAAPIGMVAMNFSDALDEEGYAEAVVAGMEQAGSLAFTGGGNLDECFFAPLRVIARHRGMGIPTLKPWRLELLEKRLRLTEQTGAPAFAVDIDTAGLPHASGAAEPMVFKSREELHRIAEMTELPFIVKGIMAAEEAETAVAAGAAAIVVSNHGGRVLDHGLSTAEVLPEIRRAVGAAAVVLVDGGVRTGTDVFKMIALGADGVLVGRPMAVAAYGGGGEGVRLLAEKLRAELIDTMAMTDCRNLAEIGPERIAIV